MSLTIRESQLKKRSESSFLFTVPLGLLSQGLAVAAGGGSAAQLQYYAVKTVEFVD
jgi:hypothetical protein